MSPENIAVAAWVGVALLLWIANAAYAGYRDKPITLNTEVVCMAWPLALVALLVGGPIFLLTAGAKWLGQKAAGR